MVKNYLLTALRSLRRRPLLLFVNVVGFSLGVGSAMLMFAYVWDEIGYDQYHPGHERVFRVALERHFPDRSNSYATTPSPLGPTLYDDFPEVELFCRVLDFTTETRVKLEDRVFYEQRVFATDSSFFQLFGVRLLEGHPQEVLRAPNSIVITRSMNRKYFGDQSGINQTLEVGDTTKYRITGICEDVPKKSHFKFDMLTSIRNLPIAESTFWGSYALHNYIRLSKTADPEVINDKLDSFLEPHFGPQVESILGRTFQEYVDAGNIHNYYLQPINSIHLESRLSRELEPNGDSRYVALFFVVAVLILAIACFNFTNLSTANSVNRSKEIGIRKVMGGHRQQLIRQFLVESILVAFVSVAVSFALALIFLPTFNEIAGKELSIHDFDALGLGAFLLMLAIVVGLLSGIYPAFFMSSFQIVQVFKGGVKLSNRRFGLRNLLVTVQFGASILMTLATLFIVVQLNYMRQQKLGFEKDNMLLLEVSDNLGSQYRTFMEDVGNEPVVEAITSSFHIPGREVGGGTFQAIGNDATERFLFSLMIAGYEFQETYRMPLAAGRMFDQDLATDSSGVLINEACARMVGWSSEQALGREILITGQDNTRKVIGVLQDFHFTSLHEPIRPMVFFGAREENLATTRPPIISVRLRKAAEVQKAITALERKWSTYVPEEPLRFGFLDSEFDALYAREQNFAALFQSFAILAIVISCVGVIGLSFFMANERVKEIGIRKVLGATTSQLMMILSKDFLLLSIAANIIVWPIAWLLINEWMNSYAFSPGVNVLYFLMTGVIFTFLVLLVISVITYRAANSNPVDAIGTE